MESLKAMQAMARHIIDNAKPEAWSYQGFGMLRIYLAPEVRLHIWCPNQKAPDVTDIHSHPWNFTSWVVAGRIINREWQKMYAKPITHIAHKIITGENAEILESHPVTLQIVSQASYAAGDRYPQDYHDIHQTEAVEGTVTIIVRKRVTGDLAYSYATKNRPWVDARPRPATLSEIEYFTQCAKRLLDK